MKKPAHIDFKMENSDTASAPPRQNNEVSCKGCQRSFSSLLKHLSKTKECQKHYDLEALRQKSTAASRQKKKEYQKVYDAEHKAERREAQKCQKYHKYHTDSAYKKQKNLYQKKYDEDNFEKVRMSQSACNLASYQTYPEVKEAKLKYQRQYDEKNKEKRKEERKIFKQAWQEEVKEKEDLAKAKNEVRFAVKHIVDMVVQNENKE